MFLELGIALPGCLLLAAAVEVGDGKPGSLRTGLPGRGVQLLGEGELSGQVLAEGVQRGPVHPLMIHPVAQALVAHELGSPNGLIQGLVLLGCAVEELGFEDANEPTLSKV